MLRWILLIFPFAPRLLFKFLLCPACGRGVCKINGRDTPTLCHPGVHTPVVEGKKWVMSACRVQKGVWSDAVWEPSDKPGGKKHPKSSMLHLKLDWSRRKYQARKRSWTWTWICKSAPQSDDYSDFSDNQYEEDFSRWEDEQEQEKQKHQCIDYCDTKG